MRLGLLWLVGFALLELWLLLRLGAAIGATAAVLVVLTGAVVGVWALRFEGLRTWTKAAERLERGETPAQEVLEGGLLGLGAVLLLLPGLITDVLGLLCMFPLTRRWLARSALPRQILQRRPGAGPRRPGPGRGGFTIEGDYWREESQWREDRDQDQGQDRRKFPRDDP